MLSFDPDIFVPFLVFSIPIIAIAGGITAGIVRMIGQQRLVELAQRERIAAMERGIDPSKLPPLPTGGGGDLSSMFWSPRDVAKRRSQSLLIGGIITLFGGAAIIAFLNIVETSDRVWAVGIIPSSVGLALILCSFLVKPRD